MKTVTIRISLMFLLTACLLACEKNNETFVSVKSPDKAKLNVIYASPSKEKIDFYFAGGKMNIGDFEYTNKFGYVSILAGISETIVTKKDSTTSLASEKFNFVKDECSSLFIVDKFPDIKFLLIKDELITPPTGKAKIRFINLSPDAPALDMAIAGSEESLFTNKAFKEYSGFETIEPAEKITFNFKNKATGQIETSAVGVKITAGKSYTVWVRGLKANPKGGLALGAAIYAH